MKKRHLLLGHSPDPDDAFMFYGLASGQVDSRGWEFEHVLQDIQTLNERCQRREMDVSAVSIHAYAYLADDYALLNCGSSMGDRYGPMFVSRQPLEPSRLGATPIAVPGTMTTAYLAGRLVLGDFPHQVVPFDDIIPALQRGDFEVGLIIHEGQLTYQDSGLHKVLDLGEWWYEQERLPLPLGGNVVRRAFGEDSVREIGEILRESIVYGLEHREEAVKHSLQWARDMGQDLADRFVGMYVNDYTVDYGDTGRAAVRRLLERAAAERVIARVPDIQFV